MKGIYLTQEAKQEIEAMIAELEDYTYATQNIWIEGQNSGMLKILEEMLKSATILPVETEISYIKYVFDSSKKTADRFPNGLIIQPKQ
jgi:hypothetical protein